MKSDTSLFSDREVFPAAVGVGPVVVDVIDGAACLCDVNSFIKK